jgi:hypothetical protein
MLLALEIRALLTETGEKSAFNQVFTNFYNGIYRSIIDFAA